MWLLVAREPHPDAHEWTGRRALAVVDATVWPLLWIWVIWRVPPTVGIVRPFIVAVATLFLLRRLRRALWANHRYRFTTWRWGKVFVAMLLIGAALKLATPT